MILDTILHAFVSALIGGFAVLHVYTLPILGVAAHLAWLRGVYPTIRAGIHPGEIWAQIVLMAISIAGYLYLLSNFHALATGIFTLAGDLGGRVGGLTGGGLMQPSTVLEAGSRAVSPLTDFMTRTTGWEALKNLGVLLQYSIAYDIVHFAFMGIAINVCLTVIEFHFAVLCATVLLPWAPLGPTAFLAEFSLGWCVGMVVRTLIQTAVIGISIPLFETLVLTTTAGGDPDFWGALGVVGGSMLFFVLSWLIPNRAAGLVARGLAIAGNDLTAGLSSAARGIRGFVGAGRTVTSGVTQFLKAERG